jgi:L-fuconate dehydratase
MAIASGLDPRQLVALLDLSYLEDVLSPSEIEAMLRDNAASRAQRQNILRTGYPRLRHIRGLVSV